MDEKEQPSEPLSSLPLCATGETPSFGVRMGVGWWNWPCGQQIPAPQEQTQPTRAQRAEATDSEARGIAAGPVFSLDGGRLFLDQRSGGRLAKP